jgi:uncharacterized protein YecT (DUF1311 family)
MIVSLILSLLVQSSEPPNPGWNCDNPQLQQEMNWCAARDFEIADDRLNSLWKEVAALMKARDADFATYGADYDTREGFFESLLNAQRGWLRYRDAHCALEGYEFRGGSMEALLVNSCKARLTRIRTEELRQLIVSAG